MTDSEYWKHLQKRRKREQKRLWEQEQRKRDLIKDPLEKRYLAIERQLNLLTHDSQISIPWPQVTAKEMRVREIAKQALFFRTSDQELSYGEFCRRVGWSTDPNIRLDDIAWEPAKQGYWFWAEIQSDCPRVGTSWTDLMKTNRLLSIEEYDLVSYFHHALWQETRRSQIPGSKRMDASTHCWLRTLYQGKPTYARYGRIQLSADAFHAGGRSSEVIAGRTLIE